MNVRRLGCLSGSSLLAVALTLLLALGVTLARGGRWFSPGPLNAQARAAKLGGVTSHAATGGRCQACHTAPWDRTTLADRCLACHTAINEELADRTSLHGALQTLRSVLACRECHTEHRGPAATLTHMDPAAFPHNAVGYSLAGHRTLTDGRPFACADCHAGKFTAFDVAICQTCHRETGVGTMQQHVADFGAACLGCHDGVDRYDREQFDHNRFAFPLSGKHVGVACAQCHFGARTVNDFLTTPQPCVGCHQQDDPHRGQLGADCAACHRVDGWLPATFDHSQSGFPLTGKHAQAGCAECHANQVYRGTPNTCIGCHQKDDQHQGAFGTECGACHQPAGWLPATFDHSQSGFPLTGKHAQAGCAQCHVRQVYRGTPNTCIGCHQKDDQHQGAFGTECGACHQPAGWLPATFDHAQSGFPLTGKHVQAGCAQCHVNQVYRGTPNTCVGCHQDPTYHLGVFGAACADCHTAAGWQPAKYGRPHTFPLAHGENGVNPCRICHPNQLRTYTCYGCHEHEPADIEREHREEGIDDFIDCIRCHATGQKEENGND